MRVQDMQKHTRRRLLWLAASGAAGAFYPLVGHTDDDDDEGASAGSSSGSGNQSGSGGIALANTGLTGKVVVVGGGMAGAAVAKYLRLWGGAGLEVTLVEPSASYTSNIMSNLVLNGARTLASLQYRWDTLAARYGVVRRQAALQSIDATARTVRLSDGSTLAYDRLVLAPGVEFEPAYGLGTADYDTRTPHAWSAGSQTTLLQQQLSSARDGDVFVMTIPKAPYRCPPGPYERACLVADYLKTRKGSRCKVLVLDQNPSIQAEVGNFTRAFTVIHAGVVDYQPGVSGVQIDPVTRIVRYVDQTGASRSVQAAVVNPIPPHRAAGSAAGGWMAVAGLNNGTDGRWAKVNVLSYESTAVAGIHVVGDASQCGLPKAGHVGNQEAKICADAIVRLMGRQNPDPAPVANSACFSPITASTASWLTAVYQYDAASGTMKVAANGGLTAGATPTEAASISSKNFSQMNTWFTSLMGDTFA